MDFIFMGLDVKGEMVTILVAKDAETRSECYADGSL